ncbi:MAG: biotin carboxylase N-terminal domain-containing protein [Planctomycetota bacterium]
MTNLKRVLVANRGEIALRLLRGLQALGKETVAVYSEADAAAPHLRAAHQAICVGPPPPGESYLKIDALIAAAQASGADAIHPGYGFLSENADFAAAVEAAGLTFIGPTATSIREMGDKTTAGEIARAAGIPTVPAHQPDGEVDAAKLQAAAKEIGVPVLVKAAAGGGGKGMRIAHSIAEIPDLVEAASREAQNAFGDGRVFLERYLENARHVEVQVVGDGAGHALVLGARDCSTQRRHQKLIEECPPPQLPTATHDAMLAAARSLVERSNYRGAGTVEFILANDGAFYFLEVNTRLQVEHPVTECVYGVDLLELQVSVAEGRGWPKELEQRQPQGHAVEVRVYAENPAAGFLPSTGTLTEVVWPQGPGVRVDAGVERGNEVSIYYDPLLAKIITYGEDRDRALDRMEQALAETFLAGVETSVQFCRELIAHEDFRATRVHTTYVAEKLENAAPAPPRDDDPWWQAAACVGWNLGQPDASGSGPSTRQPGAWDTLRDWRATP